MKYIKENNNLISLNLFDIFRMYMLLVVHPFIFLTKPKFYPLFAGNDDSDSDADDFEDVPDTIEKEGYEPRIPDHLREEYGLVDNKIQKSPTQPVCITVACIFIIL